MIQLHVFCWQEQLWGLGLQAYGTIFLISRVYVSCLQVFNLKSRKLPKNAFSQILPMLKPRSLNLHSSKYQSSKPLHITIQTAKILLEKFLWKSLSVYKTVRKIDAVAKKVVCMGNNYGLQAVMLPFQEAKWNASLLKVTPQKSQTQILATIFSFRVMFSDDIP